MLGALDPSKRYVIPGTVDLENAGMSKPFFSAVRPDCLVPEVNRSTVDSDRVRAPRWQSEALWMAPIGGSLSKEAPAWDSEANQRSIPTNALGTGGPPVCYSFLKMENSDPRKRCYALITTGDLERLLDLAKQDRQQFFARNPGWAQYYADRILGTLFAKEPLVIICEAMSASMTSTFTHFTPHTRRARGTRSDWHL